LGQIDVRDDGKISACATAVVRVTLADGTYHEDVGCGLSEGTNKKSGVYEKVRQRLGLDIGSRVVGRS
jgi:DNA repair and recombination protein RAD52